MFKFCNFTRSEQAWLFRHGWSWALFHLLHSGSVWCHSGTSLGIRLGQISRQQAVGVAKQPTIHCLLCHCNGWQGWHPLCCQGKAQGLCNRLLLECVATINCTSHIPSSFSLGRRSRVRFPRSSHSHLPSQSCSPLSPCLPILFLQQQQPGPCPISFWKWNSILPSLSKSPN